jgi:pimeloyl-ACP methyl ester carboxylesterase
MKGRLRIVVRVIVVGVGLYVGACVVVAAWNRAFLFPAPRRVDAIPSDFATLEAQTSDGVTARALRFGPPSTDAELTVVFFHGNGELAEDNVDIARALASHGYAVVLAEYRGYGVSRHAGKASERGLYADAEAILDAIGAPAERVVLMGFSLGTGVVVEMAARGRGRGLVLLAPYTSIPDVAAHHVPVLPMRALMRDKLDSLSKAAAITLPVFVAHGDADTVVPFDMGETVAHTFPHGHFVAVPGGHHTDLFVADGHLMQKIVDFLIDVTP